MTYQEEQEKYKSGFDKESWKRHKKNKARLKKFAYLKYARGAGSSVDLGTAEGVFVKRFRYSARAQIRTNAEAVRNLRMINEFLISAFCRQVGLKHAVYVPAVQSKKTTNYNEIADAKQKVDRQYVVVSENFLDEGERLYDLDVYAHGRQSGFNLVSFMEEIESIQKRNPKLDVDVEGIRENMLRMIVLDLLTLQLDRHDGNLPIVINKKEKYLKFKCVFDNEYGFNVKALRNYDFEKDEFGLLRDDGKNINVEKVIESYNKRVESGDDYIWTITANCKKNYWACMREIAVLTSKSAKAKKIVIEVLKGIDTEKAFAEIEKTGVEVSPSYKAFVTQIVGYGKAQLVKQMSKCSHKQQSNGKAEDPKER